MGQSAAFPRLTSRLVVRLCEGVATRIEEWRVVGGMNEAEDSLQRNNARYGI
ncbi:MAG TPA: hypothetical protein VKM54_01935 [Myxococcota bacterium]|nr:hypothetical protein [Myxococcota bacterium]